MKNFKKLIKEAYLGNFLNEEKKPVQVNVAVIAGTDTVYSVKVEFEDGTTEKFRSSVEAKNDEDIQRSFSNVNSILARASKKGIFKKEYISRKLSSLSKQIIKK